MNKFFFWILLLPFYAHSSPLDPESLVFSEGIPQVFNMIDPVSGTFSYYSKDLVAKGAEPIEAIRSYATGGNCLDADGGWGTFPHRKMTLVISTQEIAAMVPEPNGTRIKYKAQKDGAPKQILLVPDNSSFKNCNSYELSARTNIHNNRIVLWLTNKDKHSTVERAELTTGDGTKRFYTLEPAENDVNVFYLYLNKEVKPNGNVVFYNKDINGLHIKTTNPSGAKEYASITINSKNNLSTSNNLHAGYRYWCPDQHYLRKYRYFCELKGKIMIKEIIGYEDGYNKSDEKKSQKFEGEHHHYYNDKSRAPFIHDIDKDDGLHIKLDYYRPGGNPLAHGRSCFIKKASDDHVERVRNFFAPIWKEGEFIPIYCFKYRFSEKDHKGRFTGDGLAHVIDILTGCELFYNFDKDQKLYSVRYHYPQGDLTLRYSWDGPLLKKQALEDGQSTLSHLYTYDERGNVLQETLEGDLSGLSNQEQYTKKFQYSNDGLNLPLYKEEDNGLVIHYTYKTGTDLITSKICCDKTKVLLRKFFEYNDDNILVKEITDDGNSLDPNNLTAVNIRKTKTICPKKESPAINLPEVIEELYWDSQKQQEVMLSKTVFHYSDESDILQEDIYDAKNVWHYSIYNRYFSSGLLAVHTDPLGHIYYYKYTSGHNLSASEKGNEQYSENFFYDHLGRLIKKEQKSDNTLRTFTYSYDGKNNKVSESDFRKNTMRYSYDSKGHLQQTFLPPVEDENKTLASYSTKHTFDGFGRETQFVDSANNVTTKSYNAYNKPTKVSYPDGTQESFIYNSDGTLKESFDQEGNKTCYTYDVLGRELTKTFYSKDGTLLSSESKEYNGFALIAYTNAEGDTTHYFYDGAGRKTAEEFCGERKEYFYDTLNRLQKIKTCNGDNSLLQITNHDILGRVIEERQEDEQGRVFSKTLYTFDKYGNKASQTTFIDGKESTTLYFYDEFHRVTKEVDAQNHETTTTYNDHFVNQYGQEVLQKIQVDPLDIRTIETYNSHDLLASVEKQNKAGKKLSHEDFYYDSRSNLVKQVSEIISQNGSRFVDTLYCYDNMNRLCSMTEAANTQDNRSTYYHYTPKGLLARTVKPDKIEICKEYDPFGNQIALFTSDNTIYYSFEYNKTGHLIKSTDLKTGQSTTRKLDQHGKVLQETLATGLTFTNDYDLAGRVIKFTLPDGSFIEKEYDAAHLLQVIRKGNNLLYSHSFTAYDLSGRLLEERGLAGTLRYSYDNLGRPKTLVSDYLIAEVQEYDAKGKIKTMRLNSDLFCYAYDDLEQLVDEKGLFTSSYQYDSHFNRLQKNSQDYTINPLNELLSTTSTSYQYDLNGNTLSKKSANSESIYSYDSLDRLVAVTIPTKMQLLFTYDSFHRRLSKTLYIWNNNAWEKREEILFLYDGQNEIGEIKNGKICKLRILGNANRAELGAALAIELDGKIFAPIHDFCSNIAALIADNQIYETYRYSSFGEEQIFDSQKQLQNSSLNPWRFSSKRKDEETGLLYYGRRYYDPEIGRWTTTDPKGFVDSLNLYAFVLNDPLIKFDLYGLSAEEDCQKSIAAAEKSLANMRMYSQTLNFFLCKGLCDKEMLFRGPNQSKFQADSYIPITSTLEGNWSLLLCGAEWNRGLFTGIYEGISGVEYFRPSSYAEALGRKQGRFAASAIGAILTYFGGSMTKAGMIDETAGLVLAPVTCGASTAVSVPSGAMLITTGVATTTLGLHIMHNSGKLGKIDLNDYKQQQKNKTENQQVSINQINEKIIKGQAPKSVERADKPHSEQYQQEHIHFKNNIAINKDGSFHHGKGKALNNAEKKFLKENGFTIPGE